MYKIGIFGHSPEELNEKEAKKSIRYCLDALANQYGSDLIFNIGANIGVEQWAIEHCVSQGYKYHIYLSAKTEEVSEHWYSKQKECLEDHFKKAFSTTICSQKLS